MADKRMVPAVLLSLIVFTGTYTLCHTCASKYSTCQNSLYDAIMLLQSGNYEGYCSVSVSYVNCIVTELTDCDQSLYNVTAMLARTRETQAMYCPRGSIPGYEVCTTRLLVCQSIYNRSKELFSNTTAYCSSLEEYVACALRDLSPCDQTTFNVSAMTSQVADSYKMLCSKGDTGASWNVEVVEGLFANRSSFCDRDSRNLATCLAQYLACKETSQMTVDSLMQKQWDQYCNQSETYLACNSRVTADCDVIYSTRTASSLSVEATKQDRAKYCSIDGQSPSYVSCKSKHTACREFIFIKGDIANTVILDYCRSLDKYTKCVSRDLSACQHEDFRVTRLLSVANANWTETCIGVNINSGKRLQKDLFLLVMLGILFISASTL